MCHGTTKKRGEGRRNNKKYLKPKRPTLNHRLGKPKEHQAEERGKREKWKTLHRGISHLHCKK